MKKTSWNVDIYIYVDIYKIEIVTDSLLLDYQQNQNGDHCVCTTSMSFNKITVYTLKKNSDIVDNPYRPLIANTSKYLSELEPVLLNE